MHETIYHRAASVEDASRLLSSSDEGQLIAGGQTLIPTMKARLAAPSDLVDISRIGALRGVTVDGRRVTIGAMTTHAEVAASCARFVRALLTWRG